MVYPGPSGVWPMDSDAAPNLFCGGDDEVKFAALIVIGDGVAFFGRGKPTLRCDAQLAEIGKSGCVVKFAFEPIHVFEIGGLGGDEARQDTLFAFWQQGERFEPTGAVGVILHEEHVDPSGEDCLCGQIIGALCGMGGAEIATAHVHGDDHVIRAGFDGFAQHPGVAVDQPVGILPDVLFVGAMFRVAQIGKEDVVHLQVSAAGFVKRANRVAVGGDEVVKNGLRIIAVGLWVNILWRRSEMATGGTRD